MGFSVPLVSTAAVLASLDPPLTILASTLGNRDFEI